MSRSVEAGRSAAQLYVAEQDNFARRIVVLRVSCVRAVLNTLMILTVVSSSDTMLT